MNANELMIGDWVMVYPWDETPWKPKKITDINFHSWEGADFCDSVGVEGWDELSLDQIKPILLTPEILEKNGWKSKKNGSGDFILTKPMVGNSATITKTINGYEMSHGAFNGLCIQYIHELQHALRLCGIEKEIIL